MDGSGGGGDFGVDGLEGALDEACGGGVEEAVLSEVACWKESNNSNDEREINRQ